MLTRHVCFAFAVTTTSPITGSSTAGSSAGGLNSHVKLSVSEQQLPDDGIGTSDDETGSNSSSRSSTRQNTVNIDTNDEENASQISSGSTGTEEDEERNELATEDDDKISLGGHGCASRRVIKLDMSKLLAFDEVSRSYKTVFSFRTRLIIFKPN